MKHALSLLMMTMLLAGCGRTPDLPPPEFSHGTNYAVVTTNVLTDTGPRAALMSLHYFPGGPKGGDSLVWPYLTVDEYAALDKLVIFNGGLTEEVTWKYYPALLAYAGAGKVVEISALACRHIPGAEIYAKNYAFRILFTSNNVIKLDASQRLPIDPHQPRRVAVELDIADISRAVEAAQTNGSQEIFGGVKFSVAE